jgi:hypothetical protein
MPNSKSPNKNPAKSLMAMLREASQNTGNKGMDDDVPAMVDGAKPAALSAGEYVIPADVVSMLGDGNTEAGQKILDRLVATVRQSKQGHTKQAPMMADALSNLLGKQ